MNQFTNHQTSGDDCREFTLTHSFMSREHIRSVNN